MHTHTQTNTYLQHTHTNAEFHCILTPAVRCSHVVVVFLPYTASGFLVRVASSKAAFLEATDLSQADCDARNANLAKEVPDFHNQRKRTRDGYWKEKRRRMVQRLHASWKKRDEDQARLSENLAKDVRAILWHAPDRVAEAVLLGEFTNLGLHRLEAKEAAEAALKEVLMPTQRSATDLYREHFLAGTGRDPREGALGSWSPDPPMLMESWSWDDKKWALHFLHIGGFELSQSGAETVDVDGWLPLHHAIQSTVHWSRGIAACRGLIGMMSCDRLRAKTGAGRPAGYTALHLACNGSDKNFERETIVDLLLKRRCDPNARDNSGRTPLHLAAGTGVLGAAQNLVDAGANI